MVIAQQSLDARDASVLVVAGEYIDRLQDFQAGLQDLGLADHPSIHAMGIMQHHPTVKQVIHMAPFTQALRRKCEER